MTVHYFIKFNRKDIDRQHFIYCILFVENPKPEFDMTVQYFVIGSFQKLP